MAKSDIFLRLKSLKGGVIKGESADAQHKEEMDIRSIAWGMKSTTAMGAKGPSNKTSFDSVKIVKDVDRASTALMGVMRSNDAVVEAVVTVRKASGGATPLDYMQVKIKDGRITAYDLQSDPAQPALLVETLSLTFKAIEIQYKAQDAGGSGGGATTFNAEAI